MPDLRQLDEEVDELMRSDVPTTGNISVYIKEEDGSVSGCCSGTSCEACDIRVETRDTRSAAVYHWKIEEPRCGRTGSMNADYAQQVRSFQLQ